jgi:hypothetical protein
MATYTTTQIQSSPVPVLRLSVKVSNNSDTSNNALRIQVKVGSDWVTVATHRSTTARFVETGSQPIRFEVTGTVQYDLFDVV